MSLSLLARIGRSALISSSIDGGHKPGCHWQLVCQCCSRSMDTGRQAASGTRRRIDKCQKLFRTSYPVGFSGMTMTRLIRLACGTLVSCPYNTPVDCLQAPRRVRPACRRIGESVRGGDSEGGKSAARTRRLAECQATVQSGEADRPRPAISCSEFAADQWIGRAGVRSGTAISRQVHPSVRQFL